MNYLKFFLPILVFLASAPIGLKAQAHAGEYMGNLNAAYEPVKEATWEYMVAVGNNRGARLVDKRRQELLNSVKLCISNVTRMKPWEGDATYRDSAAAYLKLSYAILNEDYAKIMDLEEVAEESFDAMEAYILARKRANLKYHEANDRLQETVRAFAARHSVTLLEEDKDDELLAKIEQADTVFSYCDRVFLIVFKPQMEEAYLLDALAREDVVGAAQNQNKLLEYSTNGITALAEVGSFAGDASLRQAATTILNFFKQEASVKTPTLLDFYLKKENFEKMKAAIEAKPEKQRTQEDIDKYNAAAVEYNNGITAYNKTTEELNAARDKTYDAWNAAYKAFTAKHVPDR